MEKRRSTRYYRAMLVVLASCSLSALAGPETDKKGASRSLPPEIVKAWRDAGADIGWMKDFPPAKDGYEFWRPFREKAEPGAVPAFWFHPEKEGVLAKLPDPGVAFGLDTHCSKLTDAELKELSGLKSLQSLNLGGSLLTDAGLKELAGLKNLQGLYLFYTDVAGAGLKDLAGLKNLQALDLSNTGVTQAGLKHLAGLKNLQALNLGETTITDAGLEELAELKSLQWLNLHRTKVTAKGAAVLQKKLPRCKIITNDD